MKRRHAMPLFLAILFPALSFAGETADRAPTEPRFLWKCSPPLVAPDRSAADPAICVKDPTVVFADDRWHLFCTVRTAGGKVDIEYSNFSDWSKADAAPRHRLGLHDKYYCAPQVLWFTPHKKWYLVYQLADLEHLADKTKEPKKARFGPAFSTTTTLADPKSWTRPAWMFPEAPLDQKWLDFWVICDEDKAYLFFTSLDGRMWRSATAIESFPRGWSKPELALQADIFEASHTYKLRGQRQWWTIVEAQGNSRRYYKVYRADRLDGPWTPLADTIAKPFAGAANIEQQQAWTTNISHGELLRSGIDERLEIDPARLRFLFQGASDPEYRGNPYGKIPWRLGLLEPRGD